MQGLNGIDYQTPAVSEYRLLSGKQEETGMKKGKDLSYALILFSLLLLHCSPSGQLSVRREVTGPVETNCYLLYDEESREAALIDVGGPIDSLVTHIDEQGLKLKYIFLTHAHMDHLEGLPGIKRLYPDAQVCCNRREYHDFLTWREWAAENWKEGVAEMKKNPDFAKWFEYDLSIFGEPDIYLEDNQTYILGTIKIRTLLSPGHSSGSICFYTPRILFSGDVLFYRRVGRTDLLGGSDEAITRSVRRLYDELPDDTKVYPGHGRFTYIGEEKDSNEKVTANADHL